MPLPAPPAGLVRVTHSALGGIEAPSYYSIDFYRAELYGLGWRSVDDPSFSGAFTDSAARHTAAAKSWGNRWRQARQEASSRVVTVDLWGDSIMADGFGSTAPRTLGSPGLIQTTLQTLYGDGGSGFINHTYATKTGTWTGGNENSFGGTGTRATAVATMQFTNIRGTTLRIYYRNTGVTGSFRWQADGGGFTTVTPPTGFGTEPGFVELTGQTDTNHTIDIEWVSGTVVISGVQGIRPTGVALNRIGQAGRAASHYSPVIVQRIGQVTTTNASASITTPSPGSFLKSMDGKYLVGNGIPADTTITVTSATAATLSANATASGTITADLQVNRQTWADAAGVTVNPVFSQGLGTTARADLVIVGLGVNDPTNLDYNASTLRDGLSRILAQYMGGTTWAYTPDVVFVIEHMGDHFDLGGRKNEVASEIVSMAASVEGAVVDIWGLGRRSHQYWQDLNLFADSVHPNDAGHAVYAAAVTDLLRS